MNPSASTSPKQRRLAFDSSVKVKGPMVDMAAARSALGCDVDDVLDLIEEGNLAWAWDIGLGKRRSEMRIYAGCINGYEVTGVKCNLENASEDDIYGSILARETKPWIPGIRLKSVLNCENGLVIDLVKAKEFEILPGGWRRGPGGSPLITKESVVAFLKRRRK